MFGEGGYWPPIEDTPHKCDTCGRDQHPGECTGVLLSPNHRTITEPVDKPVAEPARIEPRGAKRNRRALIEDRTKPRGEDR